MLLLTNMIGQEMKNEVLMAEGLHCRLRRKLSFFFGRWECECDVKCCSSCHYDALLGSTFTLPICLFSFLRNFSVCNHMLQSCSLTQFWELKHFSFLSLTHELQHLSLWIVLLDPSTVSTLRLSFCFLCIIYIRFILCYILDANRKSVLFNVAYSARGGGGSLLIGATNDPACC